LPWKLAGWGAVSINVRITAVRKLAVEATDNGLFAPELASGITRVKGVASKGVHLGNWLTVKQAQTLLNTPDASTTKGLHDRAILAVLLGWGWRRSGCAALTFGHVQQRDGRCIVDLVGKHGRVRTIPMPAWVKVAIGAWTSAAGITAWPGIPSREPWRSSPVGCVERKGGLAVAQAIYGFGGCSRNRPS
jgi:site-specific recombinase XerD